MKKLIYTLLAVSIIFTACKKEDEITTPGTNPTPSIVGTWTPTSTLVDVTQTITVMGNEVSSFDTSFTMTPESEGWDFTDIEFTSDGEMIGDGEYGVETNSYSTSGNELTITDDEGTETHTFTVTSTNLTVSMSNTEEEIIDYMGQEGTSIYIYNMTLNATRQ